MELSCSGDNVQKSTHLFLFLAVRQMNIPLKER